MENTIKHSVERAETRREIQRTKRHESWELERIADKVLRESELRGEPVVVLTASEASALLSWIRRAELAA